MIHKTPATLGSAGIPPVPGDTTQRQNGITHEADQTLTLEPTQPHAEERAILESFAGSFADDPFWDEMMAAIEEDRRRMGAQYDERN